MPNVTVSVDESLKERMDARPEINWSAVTRRAIEEKLDELELLDWLTAESDLADEDVAEIAAEIDRAARERQEDERDTRSVFFRRDW